MDKAECDSIYYESETEEHIAGKIALFEWVKKQPGVSDVVLEAWIPETKQRPDVMFTFNGKKYVIEYQCSPISSEYYERHDLYTAIGINDIWICGAINYFQKYHTGSGYKKMNTLEKECHKYYDPFVSIFFHVNKEGYGVPLNTLHYYKDDFSNLNKRRDNYYRIKDKRNDTYKYGKFGKHHAWIPVYYSVAKCYDLNTLLLDSEVFNVR